MKSDYPFISIIILNYNGKSWLAECLESLSKLTYPGRYEIIVGDNASTDDSAAFCREHFPQAKIISHSKNYGFCKGNNLCVPHAQGQYLVFLNNDTFVTSGWLTGLVEPLLADPLVISCASKIFFAAPEDRHTLNVAGGVIVPNGGGLYDGWMQEDSEKFKTPHETGFGCGAGVLIEKKFFQETGGFDEYYFYSVEEMDLGLRVWLYGHKVMFAPKAVMYHYMGKTGFRSKGVTPAIEFLILRNGLYFIFKNFELSLIFRGIFFYYVRLAAKAGYALIRGNFRILGEMFRSQFSVLGSFRKISRARRVIFKNRKVCDSELVQRGIILSVREAAARNLEISRRMKTVTASFYDDRNTVRVARDGEGDFIFHAES